MGIKYKADLYPKSQDEFHAIDKIVTGHAFDIHNDLGRFCDEKIYQAILADACRKSAFFADREVEVILTHKDFVKLYKLDLLVENGVVYELKTVDSLNDSHKQQLINYLLLTEIHHGKLINFRSSSVEYEFVSTKLGSENRYDYAVDVDGWSAVTDVCQSLKFILHDLLSDWGAFLSCGLYNEAILHFLGGPEQIVGLVDIYYENKVVGRQKMQLLDNDTSLHVSSITRALKGYENNIRKLLEHTQIKNVQWINFNKHNISLKTIMR